MKKIIILLAAVGGLAGCNLGMAPSGGDTAEIEANFKKLDPKEQIKVIKSSPASPARKAQLIKDIEDRTGYHDPSSEGGPVGGGTQSRPAVGTPPASGPSGQ